MNQLLKKLRVENGKTQKEVAKALGYSGKSGYSMLENGNVELTISKAKLLADFYKIDPKIFFQEVVQ
ncbi:helix-turn-helix transcriptional regulator [Clostridium sp. YIM B02555]|uniref:helix-turn-helix domain-containing protein n=1 Tax=Clostridium sp. YIM B02555 TaxID=2911968 RepID=UPI001EED5DB5|nr:helix-turn-helix transcriptional regulator [Clostridium sp. YIM B02555]